MNYKSMLVLNRTSLVSKNSIAELSVSLTKVGCLQHFKLGGPR